LDAIAAQPDPAQEIEAAFDEQLQQLQQLEEQMAPEPMQDPFELQQMYDEQMMMDPFQMPGMGPGPMM